MESSKWGNVEGVEHQLQSLKSIVTRVEEFKLPIEQEKIANGEKLDDVSQWSLTIETKQTSADENVVYLRKWLTEYKQRESLSEKEEQQAFLEQSRKDQLQFERTQLEMRLTYEKKIEETKGRPRNRLQLKPRRPPNFLRLSLQSLEAN